MVQMYPSKHPYSSCSRFCKSLYDWKAIHRLFYSFLSFILLFFSCRFVLCLRVVSSIKTLFVIIFQTKQRFTDPHFFPEKRKFFLSSQRTDTSVKSTPPFYQLFSVSIFIFFQYQYTANKRDKVFRQHALRSESSIQKRFYTDIYTILIGYCRVQFHPVHFRVSNLFLLCPLFFFFFDTLLNNRISTTNKTDIVLYSRPRTTHPCDNICVYKAYPVTQLNTKTI